MRQIAVVPGHNSSLGEFYLEPVAIIPSLIAPYFLGPIYAFFNVFYGSDVISFSTVVCLGGYVSAAIVLVAVYGLLAEPVPLSWFLAAWTLFALGKMFGVQPSVWLWSLLPGAKLVLICRYIQPTWSLALTILAARGLDDLAGTPRRGGLVGAGVTALAMIAVSSVWVTTHWGEVHAIPGWENWVLGSLIWVFVSVLVCMSVLACPPQRAWILATLLMAESAIMFAIPTLGNPPAGATLDLPAIEFLRRNLGLSRFYTLGPIQPNYGAYFGIASINEISVPAPKRWADWLPHLDVTARVDNMTPIHRGPPNHIQELQRNLTAFEWAGVKYVLISRGNAQAAELKLTKAYSDTIMTIYELPHPSPYFEIVTGRCSVVPFDRTKANVDCATPGRLVRRELFYPGWSASVNGQGVPVIAYKNLFQTIALSRGKNSVRFAYAPPHISWMWLAALLGLACLSSSFFVRGEGGWDAARA